MKYLLILALCAGCGLLSFLSLGCPYSGTHYPTTYGVATATPTPIAPVTVSISGSAYNPAAVTIIHGGSVIWTNNDPFSHTVYPDNGSGVCATDNSITSGSSVTLTYSTPVTIHYHCSIHAACGASSCALTCTGFMTGTVAVQ
ncbi:MAG TPA: hypothetical protein VIJ93_07790 [bacterium]